ncbi:MAG TPA: glutathione synthase [Gammaproteobacteria bacterium]|nr:glutathione synthase [Gammaproteobacteria bacterium]
MKNNPGLLGVVMDPIETIVPKKDSTLAMLLAAQRRGWRIVYFQQKDLYINQGVASGDGRFLTVADDPDNHFDSGPAWSGQLADLDAVLMRKDPPFDMEYVYTTYILQLAEDAGAFVVNRPASLRDVNEKAFTAWFPQCTPPTLLSRSHAKLRAFLDEYGAVVYKPLDGMGGKSIFVVHAGDVNTNVVIETLSDYGRRYVVAQRFIPEIADGDKRILMIDGEPIEYALARIPAPGESRGNLVMGAKGVGQPLTDNDRRICSLVGPVLRERGVLFAGIDVIGDYLTEINVTSPTGIRELDKQFGIDIGNELVAAIEQHLAA